VNLLKGTSGQLVRANKNVLLYVQTRITYGKLSCNLYILISWPTFKLRSLPLCLECCNRP